MAKQYDLGSVVGKAPIDDTAPSIEKVYSSQKTQYELDQLSQQIEGLEAGGLKSDPQEDEATESPEMGSVPINADQLGGMTYQMIVNAIYPIGRTITTLDDADNPNTLYPWQEWERTAKGRFIIGTGANEANTDTTYGSLAAGTVNRTLGEMGGEAKHTLTVNEMPKTGFKVPHCAQYNDCTIENGGYTETREAMNYETASTQVQNDGWHVLKTGGDQPHNNMPPYVAANIWKRVS